MSYPKIDKPTNPGAYWYRAPDSGRWSHVEVYVGARKKLYAAFIGSAPSPLATIEFMSGDWRGPIPEPTA